MGQSCKVCMHKSRIEIDRQLVKGISKAQVSREFGISEDSLRNHFANHLSRQMKTSIELKGKEEGLQVLNLLENMILGVQAVVDKASSKNQDAKYLAATKELRNGLELLSKIQFAMFTQENPKNQLTDEELLKKERDHEWEEMMSHNWEGLQEEEKKAYNSVWLRMMGADTKGRLDYVNYFDGNNNEIIDWSTFDNSDAMVNPGKDTTQEEKVQETASTTADNENEEEVMGVKPIIPTPIEVGYDFHSTHGVTVKRRR